jgi:hypothetical protein
MGQPSSGGAMKVICFFLLGVVLLPAAGIAQSGTSNPVQVYGEYSWLSNSFNGTPGAKQGLNGGNGGIAFAPWHHLRFRLDYSMYRGTNLGDPQHAFFIMGGGQYEAMFHRERFYAEALVGEGGLGGQWFKDVTAGYKNGNTGTTASLAEFVGGGADTPVGGPFALRIEGGLQHTNFVPIRPDKQGSVPYNLPGIPNYFGRISAGIVWAPRRPVAPESAHNPVESDLIFEGFNSIGHMHIFANSWWSYLSGGGVEYDRHSWGNVIGAHVDYSGEVLPAIVLRQPSKTDIWGNRLSRDFKTIPGIGVLPLGTRLIWCDSCFVEPYYAVRAGLTVYTQKAFSQLASYENFALDQNVGLQFRVTQRVHFRTGFGIFHQSNGFVVPSNPGLDEMNWNVGLGIRFGQSRNSN